MQKALRGAVLPAISVFILAGCAGTSSLTRAYQEPVAGGTTNLRVITDGTVRLIPGRDCVDLDTPGSGVAAATMGHMGFYSPLNDKLIDGMRPVLSADPKSPLAKVSKPAQSEVKVKTGESLTLVYHNEKNSAFYIYFCQDVAVTFVPQQGHEYQLRTAQGDRCFLDVRSLTEPTLRVPFRYAEKCAK